jgi:hypothetical protein
MEYLLDGFATVPPDRGIFLPTAWRMCPDVCRLISEVVLADKPRRLRTEVAGGSVRDRAAYQSLLKQASWIDR